MDSNKEFYDLLDKHKKNLICDLCSKRLWFWQKVIRCVVRSKENVWSEYYHRSCLIKAGYLKKVKKPKAGRWDRDDEGDKPAGNMVH